MDEPRLRFENWARRTGFGEPALLRDHADKIYTHPHVDYAWRGWLAAWEHCTNQVTNQVTNEVDQPREHEGCKEEANYACDACGAELCESHSYLSQGALFLCMECKTENAHSAPRC